MAAGRHTTKQGLMSYLGIYGHERGYITAASVLAAARAPVRTAVESPGEEPAAKRLPSAADLRAFGVLPLAGPPKLWPYAGATFAGPFQPRAASPGPAAQSDGGGLSGQLGDLVRFKEAGYLTEKEEEFTAAKTQILGIGGS
jgi:hypothetical protein